MSNIFDENIQKILSHFDFLEAKLSTGCEQNEIERLSKEYAELRPVCELILNYNKVSAELSGAKEMLVDYELRDIALKEVNDLEDRLAFLESNIQLAMMPKDEADERAAILEIRAGTGGDEAALFASDLLRMYQKYAEASGWSFEILNRTTNQLGGIKEVIANISGQGVFARLKFESGVHRVQRVPETESGSRVHTSAATVAVLPEAADLDVVIPSGDIRIDTMRASGAGGQHVNTTDSAVRITHIPSGIIVVSSEKSQHQNRAKAMQVLKTRLYDLQRQQLDDERSLARKTQVGSGDRSERIRTYNYPQGRITDHRINFTLYKLEQILEGDLDEVIEKLLSEEQLKKMASLNI